MIYLIERQIQTDRWTDIANQPNTDRHRQMDRLPASLPNRHTDRGSETDGQPAKQTHRQR